MNTIETLLNLVDKKINSQSIDSSDKILELIEHTFIQLDTLKFSTLLSNKVVKPIANKIKELEHLKNSLGSSRKNNEVRRSISEKTNCLKDLLRQVFVLYHLYLKGDKFFQLYEKEENEKYSKYQNEIIKGSLDEDILESIMYPTYFDVEKIQKLTNFIKEHLKSLNSDKDNYNFGKDGTISFYNKTKDSIDTISIVIDKTNITLEDAKDKLKEVNENERYKDDESSIYFNIRKHYHQNVIDLYHDLDNLNKHKKILINLFQDLAKSYSYLATSEVCLSSKITVFGDSNFEKIKELANNLMTYEFVNINVSIADLIKVFTLNDDIPKVKINLANGTHSDYGYLISKMNPFFIDSIRSKAKYNEWWSERFTFGSVHKNKKSVSNMVTAVKKDRASSKMQTISKIIECLNPIPH